MILTMTKYREHLLRDWDSSLSLPPTVKFFSSSETKMILKIPNEAFWRMTRYHIFMAKRIYFHARRNKLRTSAFGDQKAIRYHCFCHEEFYEAQECSRRPWQESALQPGTCKTWSNDWYTSTISESRRALLNLFFLSYQWKKMGNSKIVLYYCRYPQCRTIWGVDMCISGSSPLRTYSGSNSRALETLPRTERTHV